MNNLQKVLRSQLPDITDLGPGRRPVDRDRLIAALELLTRDLQYAYWLRLAVAVCVLMTLIVLMFRVADEPALLASVTAGTGITLGGVLVALRQVTEEMARVRMLLAIAPEISIEALTEIARGMAQAVTVNESMPKTST